MLKNRDHTPAFDEFLELLGDKVELQGWEGYNGGLDTSSTYLFLCDDEWSLIGGVLTLLAENKTGTHTVFTSFEGHSVMWHVSTLLPFFPDDPQQVCAACPEVLYCTLTLCVCVCAAGAETPHW